MLNSPLIFQSSHVINCWVAAHIFHGFWHPCGELPINSSNVLFFQRQMCWPAPWALGWLVIVADRCLSRIIKSSTTSERKADAVWRNVSYVLIHLNFTVANGQNRCAQKCPRLLLPSYKVNEKLFLPLEPSTILWYLLSVMLYKLLLYWKTNPSFKSATSDWKLNPLSIST